MRGCLECGRDISLYHGRTKRCGPCAASVKARACVERLRTTRHRRRDWIAAHAHHDEAACPDCHTSLWGAPVRCAIGQRLHDERLRAGQARARKPVVMCQRLQEDAARIDRQLAALAARRRRQRLTLTDEDCWAGAGSMAGAWEGAEA